MPVDATPEAFDIDLLGNLTTDGSLALWGVGDLFFSHGDVMPQDDEEDIYNEEFDLVDDEDDSSTDEDSDVVGEDKPVSEDKARTSRAPKRNASRKEEPSDGESTEEVETDDNLDEFGRPKPVANYVVHVYEFGKFKRTIDRPFTPEDAEAFATEYNCSSKPYRRQAVAGKNDAAPPKDLPVQKATS